MIDRIKQKQKADDFLALHHAPTILILPNAWDVASTKIYELEGFKAIGTTSAGLGATLGYADGEKMSLTENIEVVKRIVNNTTLPVSADIESGYSTSVEGVVRAAATVLDVGAVGLNIEDRTGNPAEPLLDKVFQQDKIKAIREMSVARGINLVINARTDACLISDNIALAISDAIGRGNAYKEAGADCIFIPDTGRLDKKTIAMFVKEIDAPINIYVTSTTPTINELQDLGVSRVSFGPRPMNALLGLLRKISREWMTEGTYSLTIDTSVSYSDVNQWFKR